MVWKCHNNWMHGNQHITVDRGMVMAIAAHQWHYWRFRLRFDLVSLGSKVAALLLRPVCPCLSYFSILSGQLCSSCSSSYTMCKLVTQTAILPETRLTFFSDIAHTHIQIFRYLKILKRPISDTIIAQVLTVISQFA